MKPLMRLSVVCCLLPIGLAAGQSNIDPNHPFSWGENIGWMNWRHEAPSPGDGVFVAETHLEDFIWCENIGWVDLGDPANGDPNDPNDYYDNNDDTDFGVNLHPTTGHLTGFGWAENAGWINFGGGALAVPPNPARLVAGCRFQGYVWGENIGWINLDDATHYVAILLDGDVDGDGVVNITDLGILLSNFGLSGPTVKRQDGDLNGDMAVNITDLGILLAEFGNTCP